MLKFNFKLLYEITFADFIKMYECMKFKYVSDVYVRKYQ